MSVMERAMYHDRIARQLEQLDLQEASGEHMEPLTSHSSQIRLWAMEKIAGEQLRGSQAPTNP
jgi:hypothetical protein